MLTVIVFIIINDVAYQVITDITHVHSKCIHYHKQRAIPGKYKHYNKSLLHITVTEIQICCPTHVIVVT